MNDVAVLDVALALENLDDDIELYAELVDVFLEDTPDIVETIRAGLGSGDPKPVERGAHSLKSTSLLIGGVRLSGVSARLEAAAKTGSLADGALLARQIEEEFRALCDAIEEADSN